jgi:hypothetical protein
MAAMLRECFTIDVRFVDVQPPFLGDLDGAEIRVQRGHEADATLAFDQWLSDFAACDFAYLRHFYRTGERTDPMEFWRDGMPPLRPLPIPPFTPRHFKYRQDGVVV